MSGIEPCLDQSELGVVFGPITISSIGQADDVALLSNDEHALQGLLDLSMYYCHKFHVTLAPSKTKLQLYSTPSMSTESFLVKSTSNLEIGGQTISFTDQAEHVGTVRSVHGNANQLMSRFSAHRKSLFAILPAGLARQHRGNPAASLTAHSLYCSPVLLSGVSTLVLKKAEYRLIDHHIKQTLQRLQKLLEKTPNCVVSFLGGCLPGSAMIHQKQISIF